MSTTTPRPPNPARHMVDDDVSYDAWALPRSRRNLSCPSGGPSRIAMMKEKRKRSWRRTARTVIIPIPTLPAPSIIILLRPSRARRRVARRRLAASSVARPNRPRPCLLRPNQPRPCLLRPNQPRPYHLLRLNRPRP